MYKAHYKVTMVNNGGIIYLGDNIQMAYDKYNLWTRKRPGLCLALWDLWADEILLRNFI